jgi:hypothetical protein
VGTGDLTDGDEKYITVKEAAERLGVDRSALIRILKAGNRGLKGKQVMVELQPRPVWMVLESSLEEFKRGIGGRPRKSEE